MKGDMSTDEWILNVPLLDFEELSVETGVKSEGSDGLIVGVARRDERARKGQLQIQLMVSGSRFAPDLHSTNTFIRMQAHTYVTHTHVRRIVRCNNTSEIPNIFVHRRTAE